jgi:hypothetical protein
MLLIHSFVLLNRAQAAAAEAAAAAAAAAPAHQQAEGGVKRRQIEPLEVRTVWAIQSLRSGPAGSASNCWYCCYRRKRQDP